MACPPIRAFDFLLKDKKDLVGVEIGVLAGSHALKMLERLDIKTLYLVDPYFKYKGKYAGGELEWDNRKYEEIAKQKLYPYRHKIKWIKATSVKAVLKFKDESLDFAYVDANHEYEFTLEDTEIWTPKVKQGGIVGGHDHVPDHPGVAKAVKEYCDKNNIEYKTKYFINKKVNVDWAFKKGGKLGNWEIPKGNTMNYLKLITELHNKHKNKPIWIAGSDPSLDGYPDDFLDNKTALTLHLAYLKFPNTTYRYANEQDRIEWFKKHRPEYFDKVNIFAFPFYKRTEREMNSLIDMEKPYFLILRPFPPQEIEIIKQMVQDAIGGKRIDFGGHGSCLHAAMYTAIMMGGNPINIIGCNHESKGELEHFKLGNDNNQYRNNSTPYAEKGKIMKTGTELLIEACRFNKITVNWFKNYEQALHSN